MDQAPPSVGFPRQQYWSGLPFLPPGDLPDPEIVSLSLALELLWCLSGKESACKAGDEGDRSSIPGPGRAPGGGHGNPLQYSCLQNPMDRGAWWATVHRVSKSQT